MENLPLNFSKDFVDPQEFDEKYQLREPEPKVTLRSYISYEYLKEFYQGDFDLNSKTLINLLTTDTEQKPVNTGNWLILFCDESKVSKKYLKTFLTLAQQTKDYNCNLGFCNILFEKEISNNFKKLADNDNVSHPFRWARYTECPFVMVYREGWPQGFYNGGLYYAELVNFCIDVVQKQEVEVSHKHERSKEMIKSLIARETKILEDLKREDKVTYKREEKRENKKIDPRQQTVAHAVEFD